MFKPVPLFGIGNVGKSVNVNAQERLNLYVELQQDPETNTLAVYGTPGLLTTTNYGASPHRGAYSKGDFKYFVNRDTFWREANDGTQTALGTMLTSGGRVSIADNGVQLCIVDGTYGYIWNTVTLVWAQITDPEFEPTSIVRFMNGYFVGLRTGTGQFALSNLYDGLVWPALDYATAEGDPDNLENLIPENGQLVLFGSVTTEFWSDSGAGDFPLARVGASAVEFGLAARESLTKFNGALMFLSKNRLGQVQVCALAGYTATPVSNPELDHVINSYPAVSNATAYSYLLGGHSFYQINFPSANNGAGESWLYDGLSNAWSRVGLDDARHRAEIQINHQDRAYLTDYANGKVYILDEETFTDDGATIPRQMICRHQATGDYSRFAKLWMDIESGVGLNLGQGSDPQIMLQISRDGGHTWGDELWRPMGKIGQYLRRATWNRLGRSRDWLFKVRVTDPVKIVFRAAWGEYGR